MFNIANNLIKNHINYILLYTLFYNIAHFFRLTTREYFFTPVHLMLMLTLERPSALVIRELSKISPSLGEISRHTVSAVRQE